MARERTTIWFCSGGVYGADETESGVFGFVSQAAVFDGGIVGPLYALFGVVGKVSNVIPSLGGSRGVMGDCKNATNEVDLDEDFCITNAWSAVFYVVARMR